VTDENPDNLPFQSTHDINLLDVQYMQSNGNKPTLHSDEEIQAPSWVTDHAFIKGLVNPFLCHSCNLAEAAHERVAEPHEVVSNWRCEDCVNKDIDPCPHDPTTVRKLAAETIAKKGSVSGASS
jgi:hypothetical protein